MPSLKDVFHDYVYPQAPFDRQLLNLESAIVSLPNPCFFFMNDLVFAATTVDTLFDLSCQEISKVDPNLPGDRMTRLIRHLLEQRTFYPLCPSSTSVVNLEYGQGIHLEFPLLPDVFIVPSQLKHFAKNVEDVVCINPGHYLKGSSAGSFIEILIHPLKLNGADHSSMAVIPNLLEARARVDILQFSQKS